MTPLGRLHEHGQSAWLDYIDRSFLASGELDRLVRDHGLRGVTSNPKIFMKAMSEGDDYDEQFNQLLDENRNLDTSALYERMAIDDIRSAADVLRPVYDESDGADGFVSFEVSPHLAYDTAGTIEEARRLFATVDRPNALIKVPATQQGIPAIETLLSEGIHVNITLMFSLAHYEAVAQAYIKAVERAKAPQKIASVASFFISRIDRAVDEQLDALRTDNAMALKSRVAIANAKVTYQRFRELFHGPAFEKARRRGARPQRVLWASTSPKNPDYRDVLYIEELIGPDTVSTMPPQTLHAFIDHGEIRGDTVQRNVAEAQERLDALAKIGIDLSDVTEKLQRDGVEKFREPFEKLFDALEEKRRHFRRPATAPQSVGERR